MPSVEELETQLKAQGDLIRNLKKAGKGNKDPEVMAGVQQLQALKKAVEEAKATGSATTPPTTPAPTKAPAAQRAKENKKEKAMPVPQQKENKQTTAAPVPQQNKNKNETKIETTDYLTLCEQKARETEERLTRVEALVAALGKQGGLPSGFASSTATAVAEEDAKEGKKKKAGKPKAVALHPFAQQQQAAFPVQTGFSLPDSFDEGKHGDQWHCGFCQKGAKVFFRCNSPRCGLPTCASCHTQCGVCNALVCKWCASCPTCNQASPADLPTFLASIVEYCLANEETLSHLPSWPGSHWIQSIAKRVESFVAAYQPSAQSSPASHFLAAMLCLDWTSEGERRAWAFVTPLLRAQLTRAGMFNLSS